VRFVAAYLDSLEAVDWDHLGIDRTPRAHGASRYHPQILMGIWIWGFMQGIRSSRKLEAACVERLDYRWLSGQQTPDHNTLWRFYQAHRAGMRYLLTHSVQLAVKAGLVDLALQAIDGSKVAGNAAKDRTYDGAGIDRLIERVERALADLEAQNTSGGESAPPRLPPALSDPAALRARLRDLQARRPVSGRTNLTDPDARLLPTRGGYLVGYNCQAMVSPLATTIGHPGRVITAVAVGQAIDDRPHLVPLMEQAHAATGGAAAVTLADGGYHAAHTLQAVGTRCVVIPEGQHITAPYHREQFRHDVEHDTLTCPRGQTLTYRFTKGDGRRLYRAQAAICRACPAFGTCTTNARQGRSVECGPGDAVLGAHRRWMATEAAQTLYRRRQGLIEPVFGILKEQRGGRRLLLRGLTAVTSEWTLLAAAFNLRTLARLWQQQPALLPL
jgi:transposase